MEALVRRANVKPLRAIPMALYWDTMPPEEYVEWAQAQFPRYYAECQRLGVAPSIDSAPATEARKQAWRAVMRQNSQKETK